MRIWFNKTFSTIQSVLHSLHQSPSIGEVTLICTHTHPTATAFVSADESYLEPADLTGEAYLHWCVAFCQQHQVDLFWVGKEAALISQQRPLFTAIGTRVLVVAEAQTLKLLNDKARFYTQLPLTVAKVMDFIAVDTPQDFDNAVAELSKTHAQLCVKPAQSVFGLGFRVLDTVNDSVQHLLRGVEYHIPLNELRLGMQQRTEAFESSLLVMEYLAKNEWSVDCVAHEGQLLCGVQRKKSLLLGHGQVIDNNSEIDAMVRRLSGYYKLSGLFNVQFREGAYGVRLLEINARPSGGVGMACLAGVNLAELALTSFLGNAVTVPSIQYGLKVSEVSCAVALNA